MGEYHRNDEEYEVLLVTKVMKGYGLTRYPEVITKAIGIKSLDDVDHIRHMFHNEQIYGKDTKVEVGRKIHFWCRVCRCYIGNKTIPLRIEPFRYHLSQTVESTVTIKTELHRCEACGHHTTFTIQDPVLSVY